MNFCEDLPRRMSPTRVASELEFDRLKLVVGRGVSQRGRRREPSWVLGRGYHALNFGKFGARMRSARATVRFPPTPPLRGPCAHPTNAAGASDAHHAWHGHDHPGDVP